MGTVSNISANMPGRPNPDTNRNEDQAPSSLEIRARDRRLIAKLSSVAVLITKLELAELETRLIIEQNRRETEELQDRHLADSPDAATWSPGDADAAA